MSSAFHVVTGAAGFIGSQLVDVLLSHGHRVLGIDNLVRGRVAHLAGAKQNPGFSFVEADVSDESALLPIFERLNQPVEMIWHLAANSDVAAGVDNPDIDLRDTFLTTYALGKICRRFSIRKIAFASTSAIYGDLGPIALTEDIGPLFPISSYGAMKLASEAALTALAESHLERLWIFRFPNVIGGRSTHGVIHDFLDKLAKTPHQLDVLGNGTQCKQYLYVDDLLEAMQFIVNHASERVNCFNIGPEDTGVSVRDIASLVVAQASPGAKIVFGQEGRGWVGDVPKFHYSVARLKALGWSPRFTSRAAVERSVSVQFAERQRVPA